MNDWHMLLEVRQGAPLLQVNKKQKKADAHPLFPRVESGHETVYCTLISDVNILYPVYI